MPCRITRGLGFSGAVGYVQVADLPVASSFFSSVVYIRFVPVTVPPSTVQPRDACPFGSPTGEGQPIGPESHATIDEDRTFAEQARAAATGTERAGAYGQVVAGAAAAAVDESPGSRPCPTPDLAFRAGRQAVNFSCLGALGNLLPFRPCVRWGRAKLARRCGCRRYPLA